MTNITFIALMCALCNLMPDKTGKVAANTAVLSTIVCAFYATLLLK